jgi:diguanylate cyclase (GGDEF)-like protein/PAS domain S-box-containing protein
MVVTGPSKDAGDGSAVTNRRHRARAAWIVLVIGIVVSVAAAASWRSSVREQERGVFNSSANDIAATLGTLLARDADLVATTRAYFQVHPGATRGEFENWFNLMQVRKRYAGADRLAFVDHVPAARLGEFLRKARADTPAAHGHLTIVPPGKRAYYCLSRAFVAGSGLAMVPGQLQDFCQNSVFVEARAGLRAATDSGLPTVTPGFGEIFYMYETIYRGNVRPKSVTARRASVVGWAIGMFHSDAVLNAAIDSRPVTVELFRRATGKPLKLVSSGGQSPNGQQLSRTVPVGSNGIWLIRVLGVPPRSGLSADAQSGVIFFAGLALFLLLFMLIRTLARSRDRALRLVNQRTRELRHSEARLTSIAASSPTGILQTDRDGNYEYGNERLRELLGLKQEQLHGLRWLEALAPDDREVVMRTLRRPTLAAAEGIELQSRGRVARWVRLSIAPLNEEEGGEPSGLVGSVEDVTLAHDVKERLRFEAGHDVLTGLPNRALFLEHLERSLKKLESGGPEFAVLYVDLDRFKPVNDVLGHGAGDDLLATIGKRLAASLRGSDLLARHGGDEFTVLISDYDDRETVNSIVERIQLSVGEPVTVIGEQVTVGASVGVVFVNDPSRGPDQILQDADIAMYRAKHGRRGSEVFDPSLREYDESMLQIEQGLRVALKNGEFALAYQPIVDLRRNRIAGAEALLRWRHPQRGLLEPEQFLAHAEVTRLIVPIGSWVIETAAKFLAARPADFMVTVNASVQQLLSEGFVEELTGVVNRNAIDRSRLWIEVIESDELIDEALAVVENLRTLGFNVGIDDFGSGYNSLLQLKRFAMDFVKVDRGFVSDLVTGSPAAMVLDNVVGLSHALGLRVVAEGIERPDQLAIVQSSGCDLGQGHLWARPALEDEFLRYCALHADGLGPDGVMLRVV